MCDLDRWFNELTHKYLEIVRVVHLRADHKLMAFRDLCDMYEDLYYRAKRSAEMLGIFSHEIAEWESFNSRTLLAESH
jgi:hypothetical protein